MIRNFICTTLLLLVNAGLFAQTKNDNVPVYLDYKQPLEVRVANLVGQLTLEEKVAQLMYNSPAITRLNIPEYNWWNECLHGVARSGKATVFPEPIGLAATFDEGLISEVGNAVSDEARAIYNANIKNGYRGIYGGLTFWTPNVNIFRDPRWGRGQETYGEDPFLTSVMGVALVKALQGDNPKYMKVAACAKHFAVHSGPERLRHEFNAVVNNKDLYETYLPAFKALVEADVASVMCAYNRTNDKACCGSNVLLKEILRDKWDFKGYLVSDCGALKDIDAGHKITKSRAESAALALENTVDLNCGDTYNPYLIEAIKKGLVSENKLNEAVTRVFNTRFKLGMFDPDDQNPYSKLNNEIIDCDKHRKVARRAAVESIVLLKNNQHILPLKKNSKSMFVTGPNASNIDVLLGNYYGVNGKMTTILEGIVDAVDPGCQVQYKPGILLDRTNTNPIDWTTGDAKGTDATIVVMGISGLIEGEEGEAISSEHFGDLLDYSLPKNQIDFLRKMRKDNPKPVIAVITGGSPMNLSEVYELADAILLVWYPGEEGGNAVADVLFGNVSPSGKLPITFPKSLDQLPPYDDYAMHGRTYRYMKQEPMFPFGYGLSYSTFSFNEPQLSSKTITKNGTVNVSVEVSNTGSIKASEVVQLYITAPETANLELPIQSLKGFKRLELNPGEKKQLTFILDSNILASINNNGESVILPGNYKVVIGNSSPGNRSKSLGANFAPTVFFNVKK